MAGKKLSDPSPETVARANRQRIAAQEGVQAMAELEKQAVAVRKNMERLRSLRQAAEAEAVRNSIATANTTTGAKRKKRVSR
ncbi:transcriptional regulator [Bradyrhizobium sp. dw_78]|uniref:transcriptional regulator n=1 Tax=Bradyrhizobium sp. dw_78 TaxID=2719793 RepID=UPI001BD48A34|nr:transcriptional regulator [Bradyrhizobium sp. dw_78]